jgi:hypothetical protein
MRRGMLDKEQSFTSWASSSICNVASIVVTGSNSILAVHAITRTFMDLPIPLHYAGPSTQS